MIHFALACAGLLFGQTADSPTPPVTLKTYEALKAKAGNNPSAQVKLALWCEAHGLNAERVKHLAMAVLSDPKNAAARGLLGLVESSGQWETPEQVRERIKADDGLSAKLAEYERRRAKLTADEIRSQHRTDRREQDGPNQAAYSARLKSNRRLAQAHVELALWCESQWPEARSNRPLHDGRPPRSRIGIRPGSTWDMSSAMADGPAASRPQLR